MERRLGVLSLAAAGLVAVPIGADLLVSGRDRVFGYLAADAFYYLTIGRNFADFGVLAYDQVHATNGYHPLWQILVAAMFVGARALHVPDVAVLYGVVVLGALLLGAAVHLLVLASHRAGSPFGAGAMTLALGAYSLAIFPVWVFGGDATRLAFEGDAPLFGTLWSYANGMESALLLMLWGVVASRFVGKSPTGPRGGAVFGASLGLLTLARLDHGVFAVATLAGLAWRRAPRAAWLAAAATWLCLLLVYLALNRTLVGAALPVSGALKSSFPFVTGENVVLVRLLLSDPPRDWFPDVVRAVQMLFPAAVALGSLVWTRRSRGSWSALLQVWAFGVVGLAAYGFLYVPSKFQWHWNYPLSTLFVGVVGARVLDRLASARPRAGLAIVAFTVAASGLVFADFHRRADYHRNYASFYYDEAPVVRDFYAGREPRIIEYDDGIVAFATGFPALSGTGLALDPEAARALADRRLLALGRSRGHDRITTLVYAPFLSQGVAAGSTSAARRFALRFARVEATRYDFVTDYGAANGTFVIVRFTESSGARRRRPVD